MSYVYLRFCTTFGTKDSARERATSILLAGAACVLLQRGWLVGGLQFLTTAIKGVFFSFKTLTVKNKKSTTLIAPKVLTTWLEVASILRQQKHEMQ